MEVLGKSRAFLSELGSRWDEARAVGDMGRSLFALGDWEEAENLWRKSIHMAAGVQGTPLILEMLLGMANVRAKDGDSIPAAKLLRIILHHPAAAQETKLQAGNLRKSLMIEGIEDTDPTLEEVVRDMLASLN